MPHLFLARLYRSIVASVLAVQMAAPVSLLAQPSAPQRPTPGMQQSGQAPDTSAGKPIVESPVAPMSTIQATVSMSAASPLSKDEMALQVLNRFTYGPRPGDLQRIQAEGLSKWFTDQLNPQRIDDSALDRRLADYPAMQLSVSKLMDLYPNNQMIRQTMNGRADVPRGEGERAIYDAQMQRYKDKIKKGDDAGKAAADSDPKPLPVDPQAVLAMDAHQRFQTLSKLTPQQLNMLRRRLPDDDKEKLTAGFSAHELEVLAALTNPVGVVASEIVQTKLLRDVYSERQLNEIMVDFWLNHFNVYMKKSQQAPYFITEFERDTIRPRALGNFESLLVATAMSPAMLNYLDNEESVGPRSTSVVSPFNRYGRFQRPQQQKKAPVGLNENYARELMELHTVGVNGGYTQADVTEVAKVFTGWTLGRNFGGGEAIYPEFDEAKHEPGAKTVMGVKIKENAQLEGMQVLHMLAQSPQTAHFISTKLAIRFVSDDPPPAMVARMSQAFLDTHGDIRHVLIAMVNSPEFFTRDSFRAKVKTPQDYVVSAVRASGAEVQSAGALAAAIADLGMPVYGMQTPNGYSMRADPWNNTAALISRMNFALALSSNRLNGVRTNWTSVVNSSPTANPAPLDALSPELKDQLLEDRLLHIPASDRTRQAILTQITGTPEQQQASLRQITAKNGNRDALSNLCVAGQGPGPVADPQTALAAGLIFGSPEFQRR